MTEPKYKTIQEMAQELNKRAENPQKVFKDLKEAIEKANKAFVL